MKSIIVILLSIVVGCASVSPVSTAKSSSLPIWEKQFRNGDITQDELNILKRSDESVKVMKSLNER